MFCGRRRFPLADGARQARIHRTITAENRHGGRNPSALVLLFCPWLRLCLCRHFLPFWTFFGPQEQNHQQNTINSVKELAKRVGSSSQGRQRQTSNQTHLVDSERAIHLNHMFLDGVRKPLRQGENFQTPQTPPDLVNAH